MSIQFNNPVRAQASWDLNLGVTTPVGGAQAPGQPQAQQAQQPQPGQDWNSWSAKGQIEDYAYDAYMFTKFPLNVGGVGFWTGGAIRRSLASAFSKIPQDRLNVYAVREQFMNVKGMTPDYARVLQMAYFTQAQSDAGTAKTPPLNWLSQYGAGGTLNDWVVRGPLLVQLNICSAQVAMALGFAPDVPGNSTLKNLGVAAAQLVPPASPAAPQQP